MHVATRLRVHAVAMAGDNATDMTGRAHAGMAGSASSSTACEPAPLLGADGSDGDATNRRLHGARRAGGARRCALGTFSYLVATAPPPPAVFLLVATAPPPASRLAVRSRDAQCSEWAAQHCAAGRAGVLECNA